MKGDKKRSQETQIAAETQERTGGIRKGLRRHRLPQSGQKQREDQRCLSEGRIDRNQRKYGRKEGANGRNSDRGEEPPKETSERGTSENRHKESHRYGWSLKASPVRWPGHFQEMSS